MKTVAAFDFDGTITYWDSLQYFLIDSSGVFKFLLYTILLSPFLLLYLVRIVTRQKLKELFLACFFKGMKKEDLDKLGEKFARGKLNELVNPDALKRIKWHQEQGHQLVLVSASVDAYLVPWGNALKFNTLITSKIEVDEQGRVTGKLIGDNCRGKEKVRRLLEEIGPRDSFTLYAYGDSDGDHELLQTADYPFFQEMPTNE